MSCLDETRYGLGQNVPRTPHDPFIVDLGYAHHPCVTVSAFQQCAVVRKSGVKCREFPFWVPSSFDAALVTRKARTLALVVLDQDP